MEKMLRRRFQNAHKRLRLKPFEGMKSGTKENGVLKMEEGRNAVR
jgi:hypothetical protein